MRHLHRLPAPQFSLIRAADITEKNRQENTMTDPVLLIEKHDAVAVVTLNRPASMNAMSFELRQAIAGAFRQLQQDDSIAAAILTGNGRAFCAGLDLKELSNSGSVGAIEYEDTVPAILAFDRPIIGAINGVAATGGFELALLCDLLVASNTARFTDTHARVGIVPGWGLSQRLSRLIGANRARELHFTGNFLSAEKAEAWGLVNRVVAPEELLSTCLALGNDMAGCDRKTLRNIKRVVNEGLGMGLADALQFEKMAAHHANKSVSQNDISARREQVTSRGSTQTKNS
jgi:enoyl-CoA hydratase